MFRNYIKIAWRNLVRNKMYATITIAGITVGLAAFWLIALYVADEFTYDRYHKNADRIFRVAQHTRWEGGNISQASTSAPFAGELKKEFAEIQEATRIVIEGNGIISFKTKKLQVNDIFFADSNVFNVFTIPFLHGDPKTALMAPQTIVITESLAKKLFSDPALALNQTIHFENNYPNLVTGVIKDIPENSHMRFSALRSMPNYTGGWQNFNVFTYLLLKENTDYKALEKKLPQFAAKTIMAIMKVTDYRMELQPLKSIHLNSNLQVEVSNNSSLTRVYIFMAIAILVLIIAVINYMNLATARASVRIREVGVRKVVGSGRGHLVAMFITEAIVITLIAATAAFFIVVVLLPFFNTVAGKNLTVWRFGTLVTLSALIGFILITGFISGSYPALFLSRFKTISALKGQMGNLATSILFRKSLVVFQFVITVVMIAGSFIIYRQLQYTRQKDLGFNKDQVLTFHIHDQQVRTQVAGIKTQLLQNPLIQGVAAAGNPIGNNNLGSHGFHFEKNDGTFSSSTKLSQELMVDADYIPTMEIKLTGGRNFTKSGQADKYTAAIVNETLVKELGWKEPLGKRLRFTYGDNEVAERTIIGVVRDFHTYSLQHKLDPMVLLMPPAPSMEDNLYVKINTAKTADALAFIEKAYKQFDNQNPVEFNFLDQNFARQYEAELKQEKLCLAFTVLAIFIACLGLFGLAAFTAQQRVKEIGIRKVLGASVGSIAVMLSKDFVKLVIIAVCIATPIAWYGMNRWLEEFAYRVNIDFWVFGLAAGVAMGIALVTVSSQAIKAGMTNPVKSLKTE
ncbi:MAG: ABC transporter permease [Chitinophagaceae bacterium]